MKVLCISNWAKAPSPEERDAIMPKEVPATLKLYLDGVIEQMWLSWTPRGNIRRRAPLATAPPLASVELRGFGWAEGASGSLALDAIID